MPTPIEPRDSRWGKVVAAMIVIAVFGAAAWYGGAGERLQQEIFSLRDRLPPWFGPTEAPAAPEPGAALTAPAAQVPPVAAQPASPDRPTSAAGESAAEADRSAFATDDSASEAGQSVSEAEKLASEAERAAAQAEQAATEAKQAASDAKQAASASSGADAATAVAGAGGEAKPPLAAPLDPAALETGAAPDGAEEAARAEDAASAIEGAGGASVDVVRIEPGGEAVIAGRAAPRSELIILDNGTPIGTTTADGFGEWVFVTTSPLPQGAHEFGLVLKAVQGGAKLPAPAGTGEAGDPALAPEADGQSEAAPEPANGTQRGAAPASDSGGGLGEPIPLRKPEPAASRALPQGTSLVATKAPDFVVQLAAVKTRAGAKREWVKLQARFPDILNGMQPVLDENGRGTVVRLRTGAFTDARAAADLCARFEAARQDCLVVRVR